jgi:hypothetical protein
MKVKSSVILIVIVAGLFVLSCAAVGPKSAPLMSDSQTLEEQRWVSGIQYYLEDIYDYPVVNQTFVSGIQYYLEDIYDYDDAFIVTQPVIRQTPDYFAILSRFDEDPFSTIEPVPNETFVSGIQYYLDDIYEYDDAFIVTQPVIRQTPDYFAILSSFDEDLFPTIEPVPNQIFVSGIQYYLDDIYDYDEPDTITKISGRN